MLSSCDASPPEHPTTSRRGLALSRHEPASFPPVRALSLPPAQFRRERLKGFHVLCVGCYLSRIPLHLLAIEIQPLRQVRNRERSSPDAFLQREGAGSRTRKSLSSSCLRHSKSWESVRPSAAVKPPFANARRGTMPGARCSPCDLVGEVQTWRRLADSSSSD